MAEKLTDARATGLTGAVAGRNIRIVEELDGLPGDDRVGIERVTHLQADRQRRAVGRTEPAAGSDERTVGPSPVRPRSVALIVSS